MVNQGGDVLQDQSIGNTNGRLPITPAAVKRTEGREALSRVVEGDRAEKARIQQRVKLFDMGTGFVSRENLELSTRPSRI